MSTRTRSSAARAWSEARPAPRALLLLVAGAIAFVLVYRGALAILERPPVPPALRAACVVLPVLAFLAWSLLLVPFVRACAALQRRIQLEALACAYPLAIALVLALALARQAGLLEAEVRWTYLSLPYLLALGVAWLRYAPHAP